MKHKAAFILFSFLFIYNTVSILAQQTEETEATEEAPESGQGTDDKKSTETNEDKQHIRDVQYSEEEITAAETLCKDYASIEKLVTEKYAQLEMQYVPEPFKGERATCHIWATGVFNNEDIKKEFDAMNAVLKSEWVAKEKKETTYLQQGDYEKETQKLRVIFIIYPQKDSCPAFDKGAKDAEWQPCFDKLPAEKKVLGISLSVEYDGATKDQVDMKELENSQSGENKGS